MGIRLEPALQVSSIIMGPESVHINKSTKFVDHTYKRSQNLVDPKWPHQHQQQIEHRRPIGMLANSDKFMHIHLKPRTKTACLTPSSVRLLAYSHLIIIHSYRNTTGWKFLEQTTYEYETSVQSPKVLQCHVLAFR